MLRWGKWFLVTRRVKKVWQFFCSFWCSKDLDDFPAPRGSMFQSRLVLFHSTMTFFVGTWVCKRFSFSEKRFLKISFTLSSLTSISSSTCWLLWSWFLTFESLALQQKPNSSSSHVNWCLSKVSSLLISSWKFEIISLGLSRKYASFFFD